MSRTNTGNIRILTSWHFYFYCHRIYLITSSIPSNEPLLSEHQITSLHKSNVTLIWIIWLFLGNCHLKVGILIKTMVPKNLHLLLEKCFYSPPEARLTLGDIQSGEAGVIGPTDYGFRQILLSFCKLVNNMKCAECLDCPLQYYIINTTVIKTFSHVFQATELICMVQCKGLH